MDCQQDSRVGLYDDLECECICSCFRAHGTFISLYYGCSLV